MIWLDFEFHSSKGEVTRGQNMGKIQFWSGNSIQMYQVANFAMGISKYQGQELTKYGQKCSLRAITPFYCARLDFLWIRNT